MSSLLSVRSFTIHKTVSSYQRPAIYVNPSIVPHHTHTLSSLFEGGVRHSACDVSWIRPSVSECMEHVTGIMKTHGVS